MNGGGQSESDELPLVTMVSPCYNHSKYIIESLESIRAQTYKNIEHIIIDDCSTDDSVSKIEEWIRRTNYNCLLIKHEVNMGISSTLNESIKLSQGKYWSPMATDDVAEPSRTQEFLNFFSNNPDYPMVCSDCLFINDESRPIKKRDTSSFLQYFSGLRKKRISKNEIGTFLSLLEANYIPSSIIIKTEIFEKVGMFDTGLAMEDWDMWLRISNLHKIGFIEKPLTKYRSHDSNTVASGAYLESYKQGALSTLYKARSYCLDQSLRKKISSNTATHIFSYLSMEELKHTKELFRRNNDLFLYNKIIILYYPNQLLLNAKKSFGQLSDQNIIKKMYRSLKKTFTKNNTFQPT